MFNIDIRNNIPGVINDVNSLSKRMRFILSLTINLLAKDVRDAEIVEMKKDYDRPTRFTLNRQFIKPSNAQNLTAFVALKDKGGGTAGDKFVAPGVFGGARSVKRFELALQFAGAMPKGMLSTPGSAARLDASGNIARGQITQILTAVRQSGGIDTGVPVKNAPKKKPGRVFALPHGNGRLSPSVYLSSKSGPPKAILHYVKNIKYKPILSYFEAAQRAVNDNFERRINEALARELATRRP